MTSQYIAYPTLSIIYQPHPTLAVWYIMGAGQSAFFVRLYSIYEIEVEVTAITESELWRPRVHRASCIVPSPHKF